MTPEKAKWVKWLRSDIKKHRIESEKLMQAGSIAAARWEDGYVAALYRVMDRLHRLHKPTGKDAQNG